MIVNEKKLENTPTGGALVGKRKGQTMIHNKGSMSGYLVGKTHAEGGIKAINKSTGQPLEMQGGEVVITAPAVSDQTKRMFDGKMMTNRQILSAINERGGGVSFAESGMEIPTEMHFSGTNYNYGGKMLSDHDIAYELSQCGCEHEMKKGGNLAKGMSLKQIAKMHDVTLRHINRQVSYGMKAESEHTSSKATQLRIVKDHLYENPNYYTILKTAGLKRGGSLVKDAKKGNTPARDLNNYNDLMDVGVDGEVGDANGLAYDNGGNVNELKIDKDLLREDFEKIKNSPLFRGSYPFLYDNANSNSNGVSIKIEGSQTQYDPSNQNYETLGKYSDSREVLEALSQLPNRNYSYKVRTKTIRTQEADNVNELNRWDDSVVVNETEFYLIPEKLKKQLATGGDLSFLDDIDNVFYEGGTIGNEQVDFVIITGHSSAYNALNGKRLHSFKELKKAVREEFNNQNKRFGHFYFEVNGKAPRYGIQIKDGKNTVLNFNPNTGDADDFEKQLLRRGSYFYKKYDWNDWYSGKVSSSALASFSTNLGQQVKNIFSPTEILEIDQLPDTNFGVDNNIIRNLPPTIQSLVKLREFESKGLTNSDIVSGAFPFDKTKEGYDFWDKIRNGDFTEFKKMYGSGASAYTASAKSTPTTSTKTLTKDDLKNTKIWIGDNPDLSRRVQEKFFELGLGWAGSGKNITSLLSQSLYVNNGYMILQADSRDYFDSQPEKEIFPSDLGIDVNNLGASGSSASTPTTPTKTLKIDDFLNKKIFIGNNLSLRDKVIEALTKIGISHDKNHGHPNDTTGLFIITYKSSNDFVLHSANSSFTFDDSDKKEILPSDLGIDVNNLGSSGSTASAPTTATKTLTKDDLKNTKIWIGNNPDLSRRVQEKFFSLGITWKSNPTKVRNTDATCLFVNRTNEKIIESYRDKTEFDGAPQREITESDLFGIQSTASAPTTATKTLTKDDLKNTKIKVDGDKDLALKVIEKFIELGFQDNLSLSEGIKGNDVPFGLSIDDLGIIRRRTSEEAFIELSRKEIFPSDLGIDVNNLGASGSTASSPTTLTIDNLDGIKIKVNNDRDLARKIVDKLESFGFTDNKDVLDLINNSSVDIYAITTSKDTTSSYVGWFNTERSFFQFDKVREVSAWDLLNLSATAINNQLPTDLSQIPKGRMKVLFEIKKFVDDNKLTPNTFIGDSFGNQIDFVDEETGDVFEFNYGDDPNLIDVKSLSPMTKSASDLLVQFLDFEKSFNDFASKKVKDLSGGIADLDLLAVSEVTTFEKERKEIDALIKLLPAFQESKFAPQKAMILKEIGRLHKKITYEGFIFQNERYSDAKQLFTPQGLLKYYYTQTTQSPVASLEPACELETPNGAKSKLPLSAYLNVRTSRFKKWFGDWEKAYETNNYVDCSKMIDEETKEPKIFYHGVRKYVPNFGQFSNMGQGVVRPYGSFEPPTAFPASYFSDSEEYAKFYGGIAPNMPKPSADYEPFIYKVFLSAKNPISLLPLGFESSYKDMIDYLLVAYGVRVQPSRNVLNRIQNDMKAKHPVWVYVRNDIALLETLKDYGYDALIQTGDIPTFDDSGNVINDRSKFIQDEEYLTFYPTQVKSATVKKSFYFDFFKDIRFNKGGYVRI